MITPDTAQLLDFVHRAFDAEELARIPGPDGGIGHAEFRIGNAIVMAFDARPEWPPTPAFLRLFVADGDAVWQQAVNAGAEPLTRMVTHFWGDRGGRVRDLQGNVYWIQTRLEELTPEETQRRAQLPEYQQAMTYAQSTDLLAPLPPTAA